MKMNETKGTIKNGIIIITGKIHDFLYGARGVTVQLEIGRTYNYHFNTYIVRGLKNNGQILLQRANSGLEHEVSASNAIDFNWAGSYPCPRETVTIWKEPCSPIPAHYLAPRVFGNFPPRDGLFKALEKSTRKGESHMKNMSRTRMYKELGIESVIFTKSDKRDPAAEYTGVVVLLKDGVKASKNSHVPKFIVGKAKCNPLDTFDPVAGFKLAYERALAKKTLARYSKVLGTNIKKEFILQSPKQ